MLQLGRTCTLSALQQRCCWASTVMRMRGACCYAATTTTAHPTQPVESITEHSSVDDALNAAAAAASLPLPPNRLTELSQTLRDNWYTTAAEVAAMSKEELQQLKVPVRLWAVLRTLLQQQQGGPDDAGLEAYDALDAVGPTAQPASNNSPAGAPATQALAGINTLSAVASSQQEQQQQQQQQQQLLTMARELELPEDIMQRRMPRNIVGHGTVARPQPNVRVRPGAPAAAAAPFALKEDQMTPVLQQDLQALQTFCCSTFPGQRVPPLRPASMATYLQNIRFMLGYLHNIKGVPLEQLRLCHLLPSHERSGVAVLMEYQAWRQQQRGVGHRSAVFPVKAAIALGRFLYHDVSEPEARPPYRDLPVMQELASLLKVAAKAANAAPMVSDESKKFMSWDEYLGFVQALRAECAGLTASGKPRNRHEVAMSLQRYLIAAILSVVPDRQRTLRELEVGRTLLRQPDGSWVIKHTADDYKTGKQYGDRPPMLLAPFIYPELEAFISTWRAELAPKTTRLFVRPRTGLPFDADGMHNLFRAAALRLTGKATNPHLVRDMIVTSLRQQGASEQDMESLALLMAHSISEQRKTYDRRTRAQKVQPAVNLMLELSSNLNNN